MVKKRKVGDTVEENGYRYKVVEIRDDGSVIAERIGRAIEIEIANE